MQELVLEPLATSFAILRYPPQALPSWLVTHLQDSPKADGTRALLGITTTPEELSVVCDVNIAPKRLTEASNVRVSRPWRALKVQGPLEFELTGILLRIAEPLADAGISIFAMSTFDTDYVLVKEERLEQACRVLVATEFKVLGY
ncbi:MAG: ACT domain-containing protein [Deinococcota bacterium]